MFEVAGKVALVTGGTSGIGLFTAKAMLKSGLKGVALLDLDKDKGKEILKDFENEFGEGRAIFIKCDVSDKDKFEDAFKETIKTFKNLDIVINSAGIFDEINTDKMIAVNFSGTLTGILLAQEKYLPKHKSGSEGVVINLASLAGLVPFPGGATYCGTKAAVVAMSRSFGAEMHYNRTNVRIVTMCPGMTDTPIAVMHSEKYVNEHYEKVMAAIQARVTYQTADHVADGIMHIIREGKPGSVWICESKKPTYEAEFTHPIRN